jgi:hypothetical protein
MQKFILALLLLVAANSFSQMDKPRVYDPVKWTYSYEASKENPAEGWIVLKATIENKWHIYSQRPSDDGPVATAFSFNPDSLKYKTEGKTEEPAGEKKMDEAFGAEVISFSESAVFRQKIKRSSKTSFTISGSLEFMCCNNMQCLPPKTVQFTVAVPAQ